MRPKYAALGKLDLVKLFLDRGAIQQRQTRQLAQYAQCLQQRQARQLAQYAQYLQQRQARQLQAINKTCSSASSKTVSTTVKHKKNQRK